MKLTDVIPRPLLPALCWFAKQGDWCEAFPQSDRRFGVRFTRTNWKIPDSMGWLVKALKTTDARGMIWLLALSELCRSGMKVLRPTLEQCLSFERVDIPIGLEDYEQPFPACVVEFPAEYLGKVRERHGSEAPWHLCYLGKMSDGKKVLLAGATYSSSTDFGAEETFYLMHDNGTSMEDRLRIVCPGNDRQVKLYGDEIHELESEEAISQYRVGETLSRVSLNLMLAAVQFGHSRPVPANQEHFDKLKQRMEKNPDESNRLELKSVAKYFTLKQSTVIRETPERRESGTGTHASPEPHWRRGHWRMQVFGKGREQRKRLFIRPIFVRGDAFAGNRGATRAEYSIQG